MKPNLLTDNFTQDCLIIVPNQDFSALLLEPNSVVSLMGYAIEYGLKKH